MIHFHRVLFAVTCLALAGVAGAQVTTPSIPQALKTAGAIDNDGKEKIQAFVAGQFKRLVPADATAESQKIVRDARELLTQEAKAGGAAASPDYQAAYTEAVTAQAQAAYAGTKDVRVKLNVAIVVAKVAENAPQSKLEPAVKMVLAPGEPAALQIWGIRAARYVVPELAKIGSAKDLTARIVAIVQADPSSPLTEEAYEVFKPSTDPKVLAAVVDPLLTIAELRIAKLQTGFAEDPASDYKAFGAIAQTSTWAAVSPAQRVRAMQLMANVMTWGAFRADEQKGPAREQVGFLISKCAGSLFVMASITAGSTTVAADKTAAGSLASLAKSLNEATGGLNTANVNYTKSCQQIVPAIVAITEFATVKVPAPAAAMP